MNTRAQKKLGQLENLRDVNGKQLTFFRISKNCSAV